ncbi:MAG: GntR family transcriptional regulator [Sphingobacterium sp.]
MQFTNDKPIYIQIIGMIEEKILRRQWHTEERVPSVRELGASIEVNPNTVMRAYDKLQQDGIFFNKRGIGFYVSASALAIVLQTKRKLFLEQEAPNFFQAATLLNVSLEELTELYHQTTNT